MKNCVILYNLKYATEVKDPKFLVADPDNSARIFIATKSTIYCFNSKDNHLDNIYGLSENEDEVVSMEYLNLNNEIVFATKCGVVKLVKMQNKISEEVTFCEGGIEKMSWSPDQEVVTFITNSKVLVVMSCNFDPISETVLDDMSSFGDGEFITVGWGKKETQFHGSAGKEAAKEKKAFIEPNNLNELPQDINVSWRADGELFTVSFVGVYGRMFKIFNREGMLQYTSEKLNDLGECISWRPSGNWIGVPHKLPNKYTIGLFEKNGLRHRELILPFQQSEEYVKHLSWSADSEILAIQTEQNYKTNIYFYIICNYHWYLKYSLSFTKSLASLIWDSGIKENKKLHILMEDGEYLIYRWNFSVQHSHGETESNQGIVTVIDGKNLLLTDFRNRIVPPPMSSYKYEHAFNINSCGFLKHSTHDENDLNKLFVVDTQNNISFFEIKFEDSSHSKFLKSLDLLFSKNLENDVLKHAYQFVWLNESQIIFCNPNGMNSVLNLLDLNDNLQNLKTHQTKGVIGNIAAINKSEFLVNFTNGGTEIFRLNDGDLENSSLFINEGDYCEKIECIFKQKEIKFIGLNDNNNLYMNGIKISENVTSFLASENYLAFTHLNSIKFLRYDSNKIVDERKIERGGKLILIVACDSRTILQMPRGNLEVINPRILSLEIVGKYLNSCQYYKAFDFLRKQRINLNVIFDHNPQKFTENIDIFLNEIRHENWLNLFISDLQNEDCTKTMYAGSYTELEKHFPENFKVEEKIKFVSETLCQKMENQDLLKYLLPIITTYVKVGNLEKSLEIIWNEKMREKCLKKINSENVFTETDLSEKALKYLLYLVDVNELYNVALGMYDFDLVVYVAMKSQKDPKEYIPFLNELKKHDENYRKFKIDLYLKKYESALFHISKCFAAEKFQEALEFVIEHKLYQKALHVYENNLDNYKKICKAFADHLRSQGKLNNASIMYERAGDLQQAILSAKHINDWKRCLMLTNTLHKGDEEQLRSIALSLAVSLEEAGEYNDAFYILKNFAKDDEKSINCLLNGRLFNKALYEAKIVSSISLEHKIIISILNYYEALVTTVQTDHGTYLKYKNRLVVVRKLKSEKEIHDLYVENDIDECDLLSDTTSINSSRYTKSSKGTGKTFRSSKNRRKHERKILSLKEGNPFEDVALIDAIHNLITKIIGQQIHIRDICQSLIEIGKDDFGRNLQKLFKNLLNSIKESLDVIWIPEMQTNTPQLTGGNIDFVQYQNAQHYALLNPIKRFKPELNIIDWEHDILF